MRIKQRIDTQTQCPVLTVKLDKGAELDYEDSYIVASGAAPLARMEVTSQEKAPLLTYQMSPEDVTLDEFLEDPLDYLTLSRVLTSFASLIDCIERNSLSLQRVIFDPTKIYANEQTGELTFVYVPSRTFVDVENDIRETIIYVCEMADVLHANLELMLERIEDHVRRTAMFTAVDYRKLLRSLNLDYTALSRSQTAQKDRPRKTSSSANSNTSSFGFDFVQEHVRAQEAARAIAEANAAKAANADENAVNPSVFTLKHMGIGTIWRLSDGIYTIGRLPDSSILLPDIAGVSRRHAIIAIQGNSAYIQDEGSMNGVKVNAQRIPPRTKVPLNAGDIILIGRAALRFSRK